MDLCLHPQCENYYEHDPKLKAQTLYSITDLLKHF